MELVILRQALLLLEMNLRWSAVEEYWGAGEPTYRAMWRVNVRSVRVVAASVAEVLPASYAKGTVFIMNRVTLFRR